MKNHTAESRTKSSSSSSPSSSKQIKRRSKQPTGMEEDEHVRMEQRRIRNLQHSKRYKERVRNEPLWLEIQFKENEDRIRKLESQVTSLTSELSRPSRNLRYGGRPSATEKRPEWFGEPF